MAEIGLFASVLQVAGAGLKLSQTLYQYADTVASADRRVKDIATEVELTSHIIEELGTLFELQETSRLLSENALKTANKTVRECSSVFTELDAALKKTKKNTLGRLMLPFRESKIELLRRHIDTLKSTLQLLLQVLVHAHQVAAQKLSRQAEAEQREQIKVLLQNKKESTKKYEESLRKYSMSDDSTVLDDENQDKEDQMQAMKNDVLVATTSISSTMTVKTLETCVTHIQGLLNDIEALQKALSEENANMQHSDHQQKVMGSYLRARDHLDGMFLGNPLRSKVDNIESKAETKLPKQDYAETDSDVEAGALLALRALRMADDQEEEEEPRRRTFSSYAAPQYPLASIIIKQPADNIHYVDNGSDQRPDVLPMLDRDSRTHLVHRGDYQRLDSRTALLDSSSHNVPGSDKNKGQVGISASIRATPNSTETNTSQESSVEVVDKDKTASKEEDRWRETQLSVEAGKRQGFSPKLKVGSPSNEKKSRLLETRRIRAEWETQVLREAMNHEEQKSKSNTEHENKRRETEERAKAEYEKRVQEEVAKRTQQEAELAAPERKLPIVFKDAMGRKFSIPFRVCNTWDGMERLIKQAFTDVDSLVKYIDERKYDLLDGNGHVILPALWESTIQPGWSVTMYMWSIAEPEDSSTSSRPRSLLSPSVKIPKIQVKGQPVGTGLAPVEYAYTLPPLLPTLSPPKAYRPKHAPIDAKRFKINSGTDYNFMFSESPMGALTQPQSTRRASPAHSPTFSAISPHSPVYLPIAPRLHVQAPQTRKIFFGEEDDWSAPVRKEDKRNQRKLKVKTAKPDSAANSPFDAPKSGLQSAVGGERPKQQQQPRAHHSMYKVRSNEVERREIADSEQRRVFEAGRERKSEEMNTWFADLAAYESDSDCSRTSSKTSEGAGDRQDGEVHAGAPNATYLNLDLENPNAQYSYNQSLSPAFAPSPLNFIPTPGLAPGQTWPSLEVPAAVPKCSKKSKRKKKSGIPSRERRIKNTTGDDLDSPASLAAHLLTTGFDESLVMDDRAFVSHPVTGHKSPVHTSRPAVIWTGGSDYSEARQSQGLRTSSRTSPPPSSLETLKASKPLNNFFVGGHDNYSENCEDEEVNELLRDWTTILG